MTETIKTNITALNLGIESSLKTAPSTFYSIEPNSYGDFGPQLSHIARSVISPSRQRLKGTTVDIDISLAFQFDWAYSTMTRFIQGVMWSATVDKAGTAPITGTQVTITSVSSTTTYNAASGLTTLGVAGHLVLAEGFTASPTNGLKLVSSGSATTVVTSGLTNETPPAGAKLTLVGHQFAEDDIAVTLAGSYATITSAGNALVTGLPGVAAGEWIFVGGDDTDTFFGTCPRFGGRVRTIAAGVIVLDDVVTLGGVSFAADAGTDKTIQIFTGSKIVNGSTMQSIHTEAQLGSGPTATQAMYLSGGVANTLSITSGAQDKLTADMAWVCLGVYEKSGESGDEILSVTRVADPGEQAWNTTADLKFAKISIADDNSLHDAFFAYDTDASISIDNGVTADKARGVLGGIDVSTDDFMVDVSLNAYFKLVGQMTSIRANEDIQYTEFYAQSNTQKGILFDVARGTLAGNLTLEKGQAVKTPLELMGCKNKFGHTLMYQYFAYIPEAFAGAARS
jgi:hypothetical protein